MISVQDIIRMGQESGVITYILPFALIFAAVYAILRKSKVLGGYHATDGVVSIVIAALAVGGHTMNWYPNCWDFITVVNNAIPKVGILIMAGVLILIALGLFGAEEGPGKMSGIILILIFGFVAYAFLTSGGPGCNRFSNISSDFSLRNLMPIIIIIAIIALIVFLVTKSNVPPEEPREQHSH